MSDIEIPREVWGLRNDIGFMGSIDGTGDPIVAFHSVADAKSHADVWEDKPNDFRPVLLGGSALLDEVKLLREENAKLREVAKQASIVVDETMPDEPSDAMLSNHPHWHLFAALANAGYPKSSTTEATEDKT